MGGLTGRQNGKNTHEEIPYSPLVDHLTLRQSDSTENQRENRTDVTLVRVMTETPKHASAVRRPNTCPQANPRNLSYVALSLR